jgi:choline dehydrogenase-like flavoprotein
MGADPDRSVINSDHRAWEVPNLFIADGSVMPT